MDYFYEGILRLDWGFGNPNKTAAFIAMLVVATWSLGQIWNKFYWFALIVSGVLCLYLLQTASRGGLLAAVIGCSCASIICRAKWGRYKVAGLIAVIIALWSYSASLGVADRYTQGLTGEEDRSLSNRWLIYRAVPQMLVDAPSGWGKGNAPEAYQQWYQPEGRSEKYINLVNSHFTWLVEWGTLSRLAYILGWILVFIISYPIKGRTWWGGVFSVWLTFFITSMFSSVAHHPWMWPLPLALFGFVLLDRIYHKKRVPKKWLVGAPIIALASYTLLLLCSVFLPKEASITYSQHQVIIENIEPAKDQRTMMIIGNDKKILGSTFGHRLRGFVSKHPEWKVYWRKNFIQEQQEIDRIVLVGGRSSNLHLTELTSIVLLNPSEFPKSLNAHQRATTILWGEFYASNYYYSWRSFASKNKHCSFTTIQGEGTYLETWLDYIK